MELKSISQTIDLPYDGGEFDLEEVSAFDGQTKRFACEAGTGSRSPPCPSKERRPRSERSLDQANSSCCSGTDNRGGMEYPSFF